MGFKRAFKKLRKTLGIPAVTLGNVAKVGAAVATGGVGGAGALLASQAIKSKLRTAGANAGRTALKVLRTKAEKALAKKIVAAKPNVNVDMKAVTMPGGAPIPGKAPRVRRAPRRAAAAPKKAASGRRGPPKGGKDLKALAAAWRAAGKPGSWMAWVKSH